MTPLEIIAVLALAAWFRHNPRKREGHGMSPIEIAIVLALAAWFVADGSGII